jgi:hypothetical protein
VGVLELVERPASIHLHHGDRAPCEHAEDCNAEHGSSTKDCNAKARAVCHRPMRLARARFGGFRISA